MKKFKKLKHLMDFIALAIEGTYGEGLTLSDFQKYDRKELCRWSTNKYLSYYKTTYLLIRKSGTYFEYHKDRVESQALSFTNSVCIVEITKVEDGYTMETIKRFDN